jgi:Domain of unknown function (DUF4440)
MFVFSYIKINNGMKRVLLVPVLMFSLFIAHAQNRDAEIIKKLNRQWLDAIVQEDSVSLSRVLADDFILFNPGGKRRTKADNISMHVPGQQVTRITRRRV